MVHVPLPKLEPTAAQVAIQDTAFSTDVLGRFVANTYEEATASGPFSAIVVGAGAYGAYCAVEIRRSHPGARVLVLDAGSLLVSEHVQNLGNIGLDVPAPIMPSADSGTPREIVWGMPWRGNVEFPGLAYCTGGKSIYWGGWCPRLTDEDLASWPPAVEAWLKANYTMVESEIGVVPDTDFIFGPLQEALFSAVTAAAATVSGLKGVERPPLAVQGSSPVSGLFGYDKFSSVPLLVDTIRRDVREANGFDPARRLFLVPRAHVVALHTDGGRVATVEVDVGGVRRFLDIPPGAVVVLAASAVETTRLALHSFPTPLMGRNLMAHVRTDFPIRIARSALPQLAGPVETAAMLVRGEVATGRFHLQLTASTSRGGSDDLLFRMIPDIEELTAHTTALDPDWIPVTLRGIGEMTGDRTGAVPDPSRSWVDLSPFEIDEYGAPRAYVHLVAAPGDLATWTAMDAAALELALAVAGAPDRIQYFWDGQWRAAPFPADRPFPGWHRGLGTTYHESGTLWMGDDPASSVTDTVGRFHHVANAYACDQAILPTVGSANPVLTGLTLAKRGGGVLADLTTGRRARTFLGSPWLLSEPTGGPAGRSHLMCGCAEFGVIGKIPGLPLSRAPIEFFTAPCAVKETLRAGTGHAGPLDADDVPRESAAPRGLTWVRVAVVVAAVALLVGHAVEPEGLIGSATYLGAVGGAAVMAWIGALRRPRGTSRIPVLIAAGLTANSIGEWLWFGYTWAGLEPDVTVADVAYLLAYVGLAAALVQGTLIRTGDGTRVDRESILDALTIIVLSVLIFWNLSIAAIVGDTTVSRFTRLVWATYPVLDAILLALVVRAMMTRRSRSTIGFAFACGVVCWLIGDLGYLLTVSETILPFLDAGWMLGAMLMATSAWRRPAADADSVAADARPGRPLARLAIATVPLLIPLSLHFVEDLRGGESNVLATLISVALLLGLGFARSALLLQSESRARTEARASRDAALEASRAKSAFLATMSHEIRTPMNGVIGLTSLLQHTALDERQRQYVEEVHNAGEALLRIINDILDFSKNEAGKFELDIIDFNLVQVVEEAAELVAEPARSKGLELLAYCSPELPLTLRGDPSRLRQVLLNLVSNAVKFTHTGEVVVRAHLEGETTDGPVVRFEVTDTGVGLETTDRKRLFEPFSQADSSTTRRFGGTGLGLAICQQLVTAMGGELGVESELGEGTTFWFTLPFQVAAAETSPAPVRSTAGLAGLRALVVDDNYTNCLILRDQLTAWGMHPDVTHDGASALTLLEEAAGTATPYSLALLDLYMPGMDGLELAGHISRRPALAGVELLLLTSVPDVTAEEARANGISVRLTKPIHMSRLHSALQVACRGSALPVQRPSTPVATRAPGNRGHVLVVEDNHVNQLVAVAMLEHLGFTTEVAGNGLEALASYARTSFVTILMDCQMPEMDGYAATQEIRRIEGRGPRTPVIAMTAGVGDSERELCQLAGMDDYISKPVSMADLDATLSRWLPRDTDLAKPHAPGPA